MARGANAKGGGGPARIRFVMLEADLPDGDLSQISQAVQNALRSPDGSSSTRRAITSLAQKMPPSNDAAETGGAIEVEEAEVEPATEVAATPSPRASGPRKGKTPNVLDLDLTTEPSFESFAEAKKATSDAKRYLVVAAWFKQHRGVDAVTVDHVYTCYRKIKWSINIPDFSQPLRNLKFKKLMDLKAKGLYAINHLGLSEVDDLGTA